MKTAKVKDLTKKTYSDWSEDKGPKLAAALAYYTVFSLAPLLVIAIGIATIVFKESSAKNDIIGQVGSLLGAQGASAVQSMIESTYKHGGIGGSIIATAIGVVVLLSGASGVFGELQDSLNLIWKVKSSTQSGVKSFIKARFLSFTMVLGVGFLLAVSLLLSAFVAGLTKYLGGKFHGLGFVWQSANFLVSLGLITLLFSLIFKFLPDEKLKWKDVWKGGLLTALLFTIGKTLIGLYLGKTSTVSSYGAAGSVILILIWVYYTAQILFFGAEFTKVYAQEYGSKVGEKIPARSDLRPERKKEEETPGGLTPSPAH